MFFILGLLTLENLILIPLVLLTWEIIYNQRKTIKWLIAFLFISFFYIILRLIIFPVKFHGTYLFEIKILSSLRYFLLWSLNWPEEMQRVMIGPLSIHPQFLTNYYQYVVVWLITSILITSFLIVIPQVLRIIKKRLTGYQEINKNSLFGLTIFIIGIAPLFLFANHIYPYYLPIPLIGFVLFLNSNISFLKKRLRASKKQLIIFILPFLFFYILSSLFTIKFNQHKHWAVSRADNSQQLIEQAKEISKTKAKDDLIYTFVGDIDHNQLSLMNQHGLQVVFDNLQIITVYLEE